MKKIILTLFLLFFTSPVFALTTVTRTVCPSGCDHATLNAAIDWIQANHPNMVTSDVEVDVEISGSWSSDDTTTVDISSITTDATRNIYIYTTGTARHNGTAGANNYRLVTTSFSQNGITGGTVPNVTIDGLVIGSNGSGFGNGVIPPRWPVDSDWIIENNIIYGYGGRCVDLGGDSTVDVIIRKNIIYDCGDGIWNLAPGGSNNKVHNNTVYSCTNDGINFNSGTSGEAKNNLSMENGTDYDITAITTATNGSSDTTGTSGLQNLVDTDEFSDASGRNLHLKTGADSIDVGTDLSAQFTTDIDGQTFGTFDLGADEFQSGGGGSRRIIVIQ